MKSTRLSPQTPAPASGPLIRCGGGGKNGPVSSAGDERVHKFGQGRGVKKKRTGRTVVACSNPARRVLDLLAPARRTPSCDIFAGCRRSGARDRHTAVRPHFFVRHSVPQRPISYFGWVWVWNSGAQDLNLDTQSINSDRIPYKMHALDRSQPGSGVPRFALEEGSSARSSDRPTRERAERERLRALSPPMRAKRS